MTLTGSPSRYILLPVKPQRFPNFCRQCQERVFKNKNVLEKIQILNTRLEPLGLKVLRSEEKVINNQAT